MSKCYLLISILILLAKKIAPLSTGQHGEASIVASSLEHEKDLQYRDAFSGPIRFQSSKSSPIYSDSLKHDSLAGNRQTSINGNDGRALLVNNDPNRESEQNAWNEIINWTPHFYSSKKTLKKNKLPKKHGKHRRYRNKKVRRHSRNSNLRRHKLNHLRNLLPTNQPAFDETLPSTVSAQVGSHAYLQCKIHNLDDKSVSWVRNKDAHILTVDRDTFIADSRFVSLYDSDTATWTLQVKFTTPKDAGRYECQVSTESKKSHFVTLSVVVPTVFIPGGSELYVRSGSDVSLKCLISDFLSPPSYVFWFHNGQRVHDRADEGLLHELKIEKISMDTSMASLYIANVEKGHAGNYTCSPAGITSSASILLHVLNGEHPAAMQHESNTAAPYAEESSADSVKMWNEITICLVASIVFI